MSTFTIRQLEYFVAVAEAGGVNAAAKNLHLSQSAVSTALADLERALGVPLLIRNHRGVSLTRPGTAVMADARRLIAGADDLCNAARGEWESMTGVLTVGCYSTLLPLLLPRIVAAYTQRHPDVGLSFIEGSHTDLEEQLRSGRIDLAILYDYPIQPDSPTACTAGMTSAANPRGLTTHLIIANAPYALLHPDHPLAQHDSVSLEDLSKEPMILYTLYPGGEYFLSVFKEAGLTPSVRFRSSSYELVRSLVARGLGYSILSQRTEATISYEGLPFVTRELAGIHPSLGVHAVTLGSVPPTRRARAFIDCCVAVWR